MNVVIRVQPCYDLLTCAVADTTEGIEVCDARGPREEIAVARCITAARAAGHFVLRVIPMGGVARVAERIGLTLVGRMA